MNEKTWIDEMIERESLPKPLRKGTIEEFAIKWGISSETYFYQRRRKENKKRIVEIWLNEAMDRGNEVLQKLKEKAIEGDNKSMELYLKFVLELAENLDVRSDGKVLTERFKLVKEMTQEEIDVFLKQKINESSEKSMG